METHRLESLLGFGSSPETGTRIGSLGDIYNVVGHSLRHDTKYVPLVKEPGGKPVHYIKPTYFIGTIAGFNSNKTWLKLKDGRWVYIGNFFSEFSVSEKPITQSEESSLSHLVRTVIGAVVPTAQASAAVIATATDLGIDAAGDFAARAGNAIKYIAPVLIISLVAGIGYIVYKKVVA